VTGWAAKRFWKEATAVEVPGGFSVVLDGRPVKTPGKLPLTLPTRAMAQAVAQEWDAQQGQIRPATMPLTRYANSAVEKVSAQFDAVVEVVAAYGGSDLLCYRATEPSALVARQAQGWDPLLAWAGDTLAAPLRVTSGLMHVAQPPESLAALTAAVRAHTPFQLSALYDLVAITGSLVLGLAVARGRLDADAAFDLSRIDEHFQAEIWGRDEDAAEVEALKRRDLAVAAQFFRYSG
jgi:chaperone required for assembly of F1-ATPase